MPRHRPAESGFAVRIPPSWRRWPRTSPRDAASEARPGAGWWEGGEPGAAGPEPGARIPDRWAAGARESEPAPRSRSRMAGPVAGSGTRDSVRPRPLPSDDGLERPAGEVADDGPDHGCPSQRVGEPRGHRVPTGRPEPPPGEGRSEHRSRHEEERVVVHRGAQVPVEQVVSQANPTAAGAVEPRGRSPGAADETRRAVRIAGCDVQQSQRSGTPPDQSWVRRHHAEHPSWEPPGASQPAGEPAVSPGGGGPGCHGRCRSASGWRR